MVPPPPGHCGTAVNFRKDALSTEAPSAPGTKVTAGGAGGRLPRDVIVLGWVSFFADVSSEMMYPLLPLFVVGVLGASATTLGGIEGAAASLVAVIAAWAGVQSDRRKRRVPFVRLGYALPVLGKALVALALAWPMVMAGRLIDRLGKGVRGSPRDALIADATDQSNRGLAFGFHRAMDTAGALVGVLLSAAIVWRLTGSPQGDGQEVGAALRDAGAACRTVFALAAALAIVSVAITLLLREREHSPPATAQRESAPPIGRARAVLPGSYWRTVALMLVFALGNSSDAFVLLRAQDAGLSPWAVVLAYGLFNLTYAVASYPAGVLSDRFGRWRVMGLGWAIYAAVYSALAFVGPTGIWPLLACYGLYMALTEGVSKALVADHSRRESRGRALGVFAMLNGLVTLGASLIAGMLWDRLGPEWAFGFGAVCAMAALALIPILRPHDREAQVEGQAC